MGRPLRLDVGHRTRDTQAKRLFVIFFLTFFLFSLLAFAVNGWAATYYVNQATGNDTNAGASDTPWKNLYHAVNVAAASDIINLTASATAPYRGNLNNTTATMTYQGNAAKAYILGSSNVSHGATIGNLLENGNIDGWTSATVADKWSITLGTGTVGPETTVVNTAGGSSAKFVRTAGAHYFQQWLYLQTATEYTLTFSHRETQADFRFKWMLYEKDPTPDNYLQADGTWSTSSYIYDNVGNSNGSWTQYNKTFTSNAAGWYMVEINLGYSTTSYLDDVSLTPTTNAYSWSAYSGDTYKLDQAQGLEIKTLLKCSSTAWTASGVTALTRPEMGTDKDALVAGTWIWVSGVLYYRLATGESDIEAIHFEAGKLHERTGTIEDVIKNTGATFTASNLWVGGGNSRCWYMPSTATGFALSNIDAYGCGKDNVLDNILIEGTGTITDFTSYYGGVKGLLLNGASASVTATRGMMDYNWSGGFYVYGGATGVCEYCVANYNGRAVEADNSGFNSHSGGANNMTLANCDALYNYGRGVSVAGSGTVIVQDTIGYGTVFGASGDAHIDSEFSGSFTHDHNVFGGYYSAGWTPTATEQTGNPLFVNASTGDFRLRSGSPASKTGTAIAGIHDQAGCLTYDGKSCYTTTPNIGAWSTMSGGNKARGFLFGVLK